MANTIFSNEVIHPFGIQINGHYLIRTRDNVEKSGIVIGIEYDEHTPDDERCVRIRNLANNNVEDIFFEDIIRVREIISSSKVKSYLGGKRYLYKTPKKRNSKTPKKRNSKTPKKRNSKTLKRTNK